MPDAVVIGSGPNGLSAANLLAERGWSVVVLEANKELGGAVRTAELTVPGFDHDVFSAFYPLGKASPIISGMGLEKYGLKWCEGPRVLAHPFPDGRCATISRDLDETAESLDAFAKGDGDAWRKMIEDWASIEANFLRLLFRPVPPVVPVARIAASLGALGSLRFLRHSLLPVRRLSEERFVGEGGRLLLGGLSLHADLGPESSGSGLYGWLLACLGQRVGFPVPEGGAGRLSQAMAARLEDLGGSVACGTRVVEVIVEQGRAVGVLTADGERVEAKRAVVADVSAPSLYAHLLSPEHVPMSVAEDLEHFQWDMATVKIDWALSRRVPWTAPDARLAGTVHIADDFDNLTEFSAQVAMGRLPSRPYVLFGQQSVGDPTRSPEGTETAWAYTHIPRTIKADAAGILPVGSGAVEEDWLDGFVQRVEERIEALAPGFRATVLGRHVLSPKSFEEENANLHGGAIGGGTAQIHQQLVFRPVPGFARPETPVASLYLASSSAHPGGGVHGAAGANAARAALLPMARPRAAMVGRGGRRALGR